MITVAIAGGTGHVGRTLVDVLSINSKYKVVVLSRKLPKNRDDSSVEILEVDYNNVSSLALLLEKHNVHTVISALFISGDAGPAEISLIEAADASPPTRRFVTSDWGFPYPREAATLLPYVRWRFDAVEALGKSTLEWTRFFNGYFMDYYGLPYIKSHLSLVPFVIDMVGKKAGIPGTGDETLVLTYTYDVARFVEAILDEPQGKWDNEYWVYGERVTWNKVLAMAESVRGCKFDVHYDNPAILATLQITELPGHEIVYPYVPKQQFQAMMALFGQYIVQGLFDIPEDRALNSRFPEIKPMKVEKLLKEAWSRIKGYPRG